MEQELEQLKEENKELRDQNEGLKDEITELQDIIVKSHISFDISSPLFVFRATKDGGLDPGSDYNRARFKDWLKNHVGKRIRIELDEPESRDLRRYFEGAIVPEVCDSWEWCDPKSADDLLACRELLKTEFNGRWLPTPSGGHRKVAMSSKTQKVLHPIVDRITQWMGEQGMKSDGTLMNQ
jgi:hypothetical protein